MENREIIQLVDAARANSLRFYVCALHVHSPASHDYAKPSDLTGSPNVLLTGETDLSPREWVQHLAGSGVDVVAITDHNVCGWACAAAKLAEEMVVLPGCELSVKQAGVLRDQVVHLLAIFDPGTPPERINQLFARCRCTSVEKDRGEDYVLKADVEEVVRAVKELGGLCVAAHVGADRGVRTAVVKLSPSLVLAKDELAALQQEVTLRPDQATRRDQLQRELREASMRLQEGFLDFLLKSSISAVQISRPSDEQHYGLLHTTQVGGRFPIACVVAPDSHRLCDVGLPGYLTYIKMAKPCARSLAKAFADPAARVRISNPPPTPYPRLRGVVMGSQSSFFCRGSDTPHACVGFSDNLTCLIGGRGSGKSCIVEALRFALDRPGGNSSGRSEAEYARYLQHLFGGGTVSVTYDAAQGSPVVVKRTHGQHTALPIIQDDQGTVCHTPVASLRVEVYGQSELELLARDKDAQRRLVDGLVPGVGGLIAAVEEASQRLAANTRSCVTKAEGLELLNGQLTDLPEVKRQLQVLRDPALQPLIDQSDLAKRVDATAHRVLGFVDRLSASYQDLSESATDEQAAVDEVAVAIRERARFAALVQPALAGLAESLGQIRSQAEHVQSLVVGLGAAAQSLSDSLTAVRDELSQRMRDALPEDRREQLGVLLEQREQVEARYDELRPLEVARDQAHQQLMLELRSVREKALAAWRDAARRLYDARVAALATLAEEMDRLPGEKLEISIRLAEGADHSAFRSALGEAPRDDCFLHGQEIPRHKFDRKWAYSISEQVTSHGFVMAVLDRNATALGQILRPDGLPLLSESDIASILAARCPLAETDSYDIDSEKLNRLLGLADKGLPEDQPEIRFENRLLEELSPGQRCSALLPMILLAGDWPVVIDQPEDNLDNMHIFQCLVEVLRALKHRRQIIVATHNPNIVVSGDAEQVVVCAAVDQHSGQILCQASIDDEGNDDDQVSPGVVGYVKSIMEGGDLAFLIRARKYGFPL